MGWGKSQNHREEHNRRQGKLPVLVVAVNGGAASPPTQWTPPHFDKLMEKTCLQVKMCCGAGCLHALSMQWLCTEYSELDEGSQGIFCGEAALVLETQVDINRATM